MNIQSYIESGILDLYVTDLLAPAERREVQFLAQAHPEIKDEIEVLESTLEKFAAAHARTPSPSIKQALLAQIDTPTVATKSTETPVVSMFSTRFAAAASLMLLVASGIGNFTLYQNWQTAKNRTETLLAEKSQLAELRTSEASFYREEVAALAHPDVKQVVLKGTDNAPTAKVTIYWNKTKTATLATVQNLAALPSDKQYQLWALLDGKPIDAGLLDTIDTPQRMKNIANAQAFAITVEPRGGSASPHLETLCAMNTI